MIEIAGGIVLAVLFLALLPYLVVAAFYALLALLTLGVAVLVVWGTISDPGTAMLWWGGLVGFVALIVVLEVLNKGHSPTDDEIVKTTRRAAALLAARKHGYACGFKKRHFVEYGLKPPPAPRTDKQRIIAGILAYAATLLLVVFATVGVEAVGKFGLLDGMLHYLAALPTLAVFWLLIWPLLNPVATPAMQALLRLPSIPAAQERQI